MDIAVVGLGLIGGSLAKTVKLHTDHRVLGTDADLQNVNLQRHKLQDAGVLVCKTNARAAMLAGLIIRRKQEMDQQ